MRRFAPWRMLMAFGGSLMCLFASAAYADSPWASTAQSSGQHPIEVARFGKGAQNVLVVGSLFGNDPEALELMDAACTLSRQYPPPEPITLLFVRTLNPDGAADLVHTNSHGVDLNRNFPSPYFTSIPNRLTGSAPASEVETQYMLRVLQEYKPVRVIHVRGGVGENPLILINDIWVTRGQNPTPPEYIKLGFFDHSFKAGSLEEYATRELKTSVATVVLAALGKKNMDAGELLRFATGHLQSPSPPASLAEKTGEKSARDAAPVATIPEAASIPPARTQGRTPVGATSRGEVELLPTPPEFVTTGQTGAFAETPDGRYFELPPPPH